MKSSQSTRRQRVEIKAAMIESDHRAELASADEEATHWLAARTMAAFFGRPNVRLELDTHSDCEG